MRTLLRSAVWLVCLGLVAWGVYAGRQYLLARRAGGAISSTIERDWPEGDVPAVGTRRRLLAAAESLQSGDFRPALTDLEADDSVSAAERSAAQRFFGERRDLRSRFVAAAEAAATLEQEGDDVGAVRSALACAVRAAARRDDRAVLREVEIAEAAVEGGLAGAGSAPVASGKEAVAGLLHHMGPSYRLGQELLTEGLATVEKLLIRARQYYDLGDFARAAALVRLAAQLAGLTPVTTTADTPPAWFAALEPADLRPADRASAEAAVELCRSMAAAAEPSAPVRTLLRQADRELATEQFDEALWWATVTLNALGMSDDEIAAATGLPAP